MNETARFLSLVLAVALLAGCGPTHYLYQSDGQFTLPGGETRAAALYWYKDEGRVWYGPKYEQTETSVKMRVCRVGTGTFAGGEAGVPVKLQSDENDFRVAHITETGELLSLPEPERVPMGSPCGLILVDGHPVASRALELGVTPVVAILCKDINRPETYPAVAKYAFEPVSRKEVEETPEGQRPAPEPCPVPD